MPIHSASLSSWFDGEETLIDPGTYTYVGDPAWRNRFRGTAAHNTIASYAKREGERLLGMYESEARGEAETNATKAKKADVWMQRADLCAFVLLGDPAARLPSGEAPLDLK